VEDQHHVAGEDRLERAFAFTDGGDADLGPARDGVDAHLVDVDAEVVGGGERGLDVPATRAQIADDSDGVARFALAQLELLAKQRCELGRIDLLRADCGLDDFPRKTISTQRVCKGWRRVNGRSLAHIGVQRTGAKGLPAACCDSVKTGAQTSMSARLFMSGTMISG
jgi:hypothetical protein